MNWLKNLTVLEHVFLWLGVAATAFLILQIIMLCFSSFGDSDIDGDGDIDADTDAGVTIFTVKSITAFFAVGCWAGLLCAALVEDNLKWVSIIVAVAAGAAALVGVAFAMYGMKKLQCNGALQMDKMEGKIATVYVGIPASRAGRGKITLTAQGKFIELDAVTDEAEKLSVDEVVNIVKMDGDCAVVMRAQPSEEIKEDEKGGKND